MVVLGIVGATGVVGEEVISLLNNPKYNKLNFDNIKLYASKSIGKILTVGGKEYVVEKLQEKSFKEVDYAILASSSEVSELCYMYAKDSCVLIDNSSRFRMVKDIPLVIPEINMDLISRCDSSPTIISNPNCSTIIMLMPLVPLHKINPIKRIDVSTYQASSGAGRNAMNELRGQIDDIAEGENELDTTIFKKQYLLNAFVHNSEKNSETGYCEEETKIINETHKILQTNDIEVYPTCIRIPTIRCHMESITVTFEHSFSCDKINEILDKSDGIILDDDPHPLKYENTHDVAVGHIRKSMYNDKTFSMVVVGDQLLKGAALNAVQILNKIVTR